MTPAIAAELRAAIETAGWRADPPEDPVSGEAYVGLLRRLYAVGRSDLPVGRLLEGHVDAVQIVRRYGDVRQVERLRDALARGATLGVWNVRRAGEYLRLEGATLSGGKSYASGAGVLSHALVTADTAEGARLLLVDLERAPPAIDRTWWRITGMQRSETHRVRWGNVAVTANERIGGPGDYAREPFFSGGALRFVAVHAGGVAGLLDRTRDHLVSAGRDSDPFQQARLAELFALAEGAAAAVRRAAEAWFALEEEARIPRVASARLAVSAAADRAMQVAREAVGLEGHFLAHPLAGHLADLAVYLRQPAPDAQRLRVGAAVAAGVLAADL